MSIISANSPVGNVRSPDGNIRLGLFSEEDAMSEENHPLLKPNDGISELVLYSDDDDVEISQIVLHCDSPKSSTFLNKRRKKYNFMENQGVQILPIFSENYIKEHLFEKGA